MKMSFEDSLVEQIISSTDDAVHVLLPFPREKSNAESISNGETRTFPVLRIRSSGFFRFIRQLIDQILHPL